MKPQFVSIAITLSAFIFIASCQKELKTQQDNPVLAQANTVTSKTASRKIYVSNIDQLYAAINDPANEGGTIVLDSGIYLLNPNYPRAGRLEFLRDMSLTGQPGRSGNVIIDVSLMPAQALIIPPSPTYPVTLRTGPIRMGNGNNSIEWLTIQNNPAHSIRSLVQTDIVAAMYTRVRIAHCVVKGSSIGLNIINRDAVSNGRNVDAEIEDNEIVGNVVPQFGSGIQVQNSSGLSNAVIKARLKRNYIHGNKAGILVFNSSGQQNTIEISSNDDRVEDNGLGLMFNGGFCETATMPTLNNTVKFEAHGTTVRRNEGRSSTPFLFPACGVYAAGGEAFPPFALPGTAHYNSLELSFYGCDISDNMGTDQIIAFGGHSFHSLSTPVGTNNATKIYLYGVSKDAIVNAVQSLPYEATGTNTVNVYR